MPQLQTGGPTQASRFAGLLVEAHVIFHMAYDNDGTATFVFESEIVLALAARIAIGSWLTVHTRGGGS